MLEQALKNSQYIENLQAVSIAKSVDISFTSFGQI